MSEGTQGTAATGAPVTVRERIERHALATEIMRVRAVLAVAWAIWVVGIGFDLITYRVLGGGPLWLILVTRLTSLAFHAGVAWHLFHGALATPRLTRALIVATFPLSVFAQTLLAAALGGVYSPYIGGVFIVMICMGAAITLHWKKAAPLMTLTTCMFPAGMAVGYAVSPELRALLHDPYLRNVLLLEVLVVFSAGNVAAWASHGIWTLRQGLVESRSVGRYRLIRRIGRGGMGEVWHAHDRATRREVALKILAHRVEGTEPKELRAAVDRFEREIETTARLEHPNVVRILDWGATDDGIWYYAMELLDGSNLAAAVEAHGPLAPALVVQIGVQAARALAAAHAAGIVHRDVKPANVMLVEQAGMLVVKVLDFGVAHVEGDDKLTKTGALIGTPAFMAPEAMMAGEASRASDVWSLAATLRFAATGAQPGEPTTRELPAELARVLDAAMAKDPAQRPADSAALLAALAALDLARTTPAMTLGGLTAGPAAAAVDPEAPTVAPAP